MGLPKEEAYAEAIRGANNFLPAANFDKAEILRFHRVLQLAPQHLADLSEAEISSSGYVVHTLEAAVWYLLNYNTYAATVLAAVNLGDDTDTTGAVVGGLAGLAYGEAGIPAEWLAVLARRADVENLASRPAAQA